MATPPSRLKSRHPYNQAAQEMLISIPEDLTTKAWLAAAWKQEWESAGQTRLHHYIQDPGDSAACECGEPEQTADHIITTCPWHRPPSEEGLFQVGPETREWLHDTKLDI
ncbi:unnamed protein product [Arctogadus glacialis]